MTEHSQLDQTDFRRILTRNISLPLGLGLLGAIVFIALILNLLNVLNWVEHTERVIGEVNELGKLSGDLQSGLRGYLLVGDEAYLAPYRIAKPKFLANLDGLSELVSDNPIQIERLRIIRAQESQWDSYAQAAIAARKSDSNYMELARSQGKVEFEEMRKELSAFLEMEQRLLKERSDSARTVTVVSITLFIIFSLLTSGLIAFFGRRELIHLSSTYGNILKEQQEHSEYLQLQSWMNAGQAEIVGNGLGQLALPELGNIALVMISRYVESKVGAIYLREDDESLSRFATYGFDEEHQSKTQVIQEKQGLVAQAVYERRILQLDNLPTDYMKVNSGMGNTIPTHALIVPITSESKIIGVIELGFLQPITEREVDFLKLITGNLGTAIDMTLSRQRLQNAYAETQQLNEELQVQQEELRTANEELEEQSSILEESHSTLENQKAELEQTNEQLSHQAHILDQRNDALSQAQVDLESKANELKQASQYKSEFLANMSHELRTPLNSSLILSKLLSDNAEGNLTAEQVMFAQTIYSSGNDLLNLINDILDISKVEAGKLELHSEQLSVKKICDSLKSFFMPIAAEKKLTFSIEIAPKVNDKLFNDRQRIEQILKNLLSNAFKFTEAGSVNLKVSQPNDDEISFAVTDSGIGIDPKNQKAIFDAFRQADGTINRKYGGTGLGLSISRDLSSLLGGYIDLESEAGVGSTFTLIIPTTLKEENKTLSTGKVETSKFENPPELEAKIAPVEKTEITYTGPQFPDDRADESQSHRLVLVIEDDPSFAKILYDVAHEMQYRCIVAHTAAEAMQLAIQYMPKAILLDIELPDISGLNLLQQLKEKSETRHIPVHAVSAADHRVAAMNLGAIGYAVKPKSREELMEVFNRLEDKFTQKIKHVLLVEDDARQRESVVHLISDQDVEITAVATGEEALKALKDTLYDCMIIDLKLPDMNGDELLEHMSTQEIRSFPPVIIYTGRNLTKTEEERLLKYSRSIIIKGARSPERLLDEVTLFLHKVESQLSTEHQSMLKTVRSRDRIFEGRKILLVDDDVRNIFALTKVLEQKGVAVEIARNGHEAIAKLDGMPEIDLVLMDIMMPEMDGNEATRRIRQDPRFQRLPIIAVTAKAMKDDQELCMKAGANDYLAKPIDLTRLQSLLRVWMPNMERL